MSDDTLQFHILNGFEDPLINETSWNEIVGKSSGNFIFMTYQWQKSWWEIFGRGTLLLIVALKSGEIRSIAPLFEDGKMLFFVGSGGSDYLDFIGNNDATILAGMLKLAKENVTGFVGFRFYHIPEESESKNMLHSLALKNDWEFQVENEWPAPFMAIQEFPVHFEQAINKKSLLRHDTWFRKNGTLKVEHYKRKEEILPHLNELFEQHKKRWESTPYPSMFNEIKQQLFFIKLCEALSDSGWIRFTRIRWNGNSIALHLGFNFNGSFLWYKPSFDITLSKKSPGEVLLRNLLIEARNEHSHTFDFGMGDEEFKKRFATNVRIVKTYGIYTKKTKDNN